MRLGWRWRWGVGVDCVGVRSSEDLLPYVCGGHTCHFSFDNELRWLLVRRSLVFVALSSVSFQDERSDWGSFETGRIGWGTCGLRSGVTRREFRGHIESLLLRAPALFSPSPPTVSSTPNHNGAQTSAPSPLPPSLHTTSDLHPMPRSASPKRTYPAPSQTNTLCPRRPDVPHAHRSWALPTRG